MHKSAIAIACGFLFVGFTAHGEIVDKVVATVDTEVILQSEILELIRPELAVLRQSVSSQEDFQNQADALIKATVNEAVENRILVREALLSGVEVPDAMVEKSLEDYRDLYSSNEEFRKELERTGMTLSDMRERRRKNLMAQYMGIRKRDEFAKQAVVSESDVAQYYQDNIASFQRSEQVRVRQIFMPASSDSAERARVRAQLEEIKGELATGSDFGELAAAHSEAPGAEEGGIIGWIQRGDLVKPLDDAVWQLQPGEVSGIVETDTGFSVLRVDEQREAGQQSLEDVRTEIEPILRNQAAMEKYEKWMADLRKRSRVRLFI